jgi:hypothetical protein
MHFTRYQQFKELNKTLYKIFTNMTCNIFYPVDLLLRNITKLVSLKLEHFSLRYQFSKQLNKSAKLFLKSVLKKIETLTAGCTRCSAPWTSPGHCRAGLVTPRVSEPAAGEEPSAERMAPPTSLRRGGLNQLEHGVD